jgi:hypothetical protein
MLAQVHSSNAALSAGGRCAVIGRARLGVAEHLVPPSRLTEWIRVELVAGSTPLSTVCWNMLITCLIACLTQPLQQLGHAGHQLLGCLHCRGQIPCPLSPSFDWRQRNGSLQCSRVECLVQRNLQFGHQAVQQQ